MKSYQFLKLFITEDVYLHPSDQAKETATSSSGNQPSEITSMSAVIDPATMPVASDQKYDPPAYLGRFTKKVMVLNHSAGLQFDHQELLFRILEAIGLSKEDIALVPSGHLKSKEDFDWVKNKEKRLFLAFGLPDNWAEKINTHYEKYKVVKTNNYPIMFIDSLTALNADIELKKRLWEKLKNLSIE